MHTDLPNRPSFDFDAFLRQVKKIVPIAPSFRNPTKFFLANGGSFSLESGASVNLAEAYLEASTPECKSPMELLESHLALQQLATDSIRRQFPDRTVRLIQGNHDGNGHTYGQHESYEVNVANGVALLGWRIGIALLLPCVLAYRVLAVAWLTFILILAQIDSSARAMLRYFSKRPVNKNIKEKASSMLVSSRWIGACSWGLRTLHAPMSTASSASVVIARAAPFFVATLGSRICVSVGHSHWVARFDCFARGNESRLRSVILVYAKPRNTFAWGALPWPST